MSISPDISSPVSCLTRGFNNNVVPYIKPVVLTGGALITAKFACEAAASSGLFSWIPGASFVAPWVPSIISSPHILSLLPEFIQSHPNFVFSFSAMKTITFSHYAIESIKEARANLKLRNMIREQLKDKIADPKKLDEAVDQIGSRLEQEERFLEAHLEKDTLDMQQQAMQRQPAAAGADQDQPAPQEALADPAQPPAEPKDNPIDNPLAPVVDGSENPEAAHVGQQPLQQPVASEAGVQEGDRPPHQLPQEQNAKGPEASQSKKRAREKSPARSHVMTLRPQNGLHRMQKINVIKTQ